MSDDNDSSSTTTVSLEEKMKSWEASEEEIKAATLGGVVPGTSIGGAKEADDAGRTGKSAFVLFCRMNSSRVQYEMKY